MRFNIILAVSMLCTVVSGYTTSERLSAREVEVINARRDLLDFAQEIVELASRGSKIKGQYNVPGGKGKQARKSYPISNP
jgi:hypothetical protein